MGLMHGCFYPKHVFARKTKDGFEVRLIDLEKTRPLWLGRRDRIRDMEQFTRYMPKGCEADLIKLLAAYLDCLPDDPKIGVWLEYLKKRQQHKKR
jgi:hypothetical protein